MLSVRKIIYYILKEQSHIKKFVSYTRLPFTVRTRWSFYSIDQTSFRTEGNVVVFGPTKLLIKECPLYTQFLLLSLAV
jgi:hypothetical protein